MSDDNRLKDLSGLAEGVAVPGFDPEAHGIGGVHLGPGAFHRAHQAVYTDSALAASGGDWKIIGISLRSAQVAHALNPQNGLYTLIERGVEGDRARIIGSLDRIICTADSAASSDAALAALTAAPTRIVSSTITEKAYGIDRQSGAVDTTHPAVQADLATPRQPVGALGLLVEALRQRRKLGRPAFTVLCCDNLPDNGKLIRAGVLDFAARVDSGLAAWIERNATFPSTMVDRITPAGTDETRSLCHTLTGRDDHACVETEQFTQWVVEDDFVQGRPDWAAAGALFVADVAPYERMKLRMLNGAHSMLAYAGFLNGCTHVRDVMAQRELSWLVDRHMRSAAATLEPLAGMDYDVYRGQLMERFRNPSLAHETYQIAMDGTEKLAQRLLLPALDAIRMQQDLQPLRKPA